MTTKLRRTLSFVFVLAMLLSLALPALAEGTISGAEPQEILGAKDAPAGTLDAAELGAEKSREIFVSAAGSDGNDGSEAKPLATLAAAAEAANAAQENTVYVILLSDLTVGSTARFLGKNVILMSNEGACMLSRSAEFAKARDALRGSYNPAMIEVGDLQGAAPARLSVDSVILNDCGAHEGSEYLPQVMQPGEGESNEERVQDAIIAVYGGSVLVLNPGTELLNFGGLSAVRVDGGSTLTVEDGCSVKDTGVVDAPEGLKAISADSPDQVRIGSKAVVAGHYRQDAEPEQNAEPEENGEPEENAEPEENDAPADSAEPEEDGAPADGQQENTEPEGNPDPEENAGQTAGEPAGGEQDGEGGGILQEGSIEAFSTSGAGEISGIDGLGGLTGGDGSDSGLTWTVDKEELYLGVIPYRLTYTMKMQLSDSLVKVISAAKDSVNSATGSLTVTLDNRMTFKLTDEDTVDYTFTSKIFRLSDAQEQPGTRQITLKFELADDWKNHVSELGESFTFTCVGRLPVTSFTEQDFNDFLVSRGKVDSLSFNIGGKTKDYATGIVEKEAKTKLLPVPTVTLVYDANGGEGAPASKLVSAQTGYVLDTETVPTHADANGKPVVFIGWSETQDKTLYSRKDTAPATVTTLDIGIADVMRTVYAVYGYDENEDGVADVTQRLVELSFDANGGSGAPAPILAAAKADVGVSIDIPEQEPTLKYHTFQGWSKDAKATEAEYKYNSSKKSQQDILVTKDTVLYAVWKENPTYTLYYNANGGSGAPAAQSGVSDENDTVTLTITFGVPTRNGYTFLGWAVSRNGAAAYYAGNNVKIKGGNVTLYAAWQKGSSSYNNGGSGGGSSSGAPKTGDEAPVALYAALAVISLGAVGAGGWLLFHKKKK